MGSQTYGSADEPVGSGEIMRIAVGGQVRWKNVGEDEMPATFQTCHPHGPRSAGRVPGDGQAVSDQDVEVAPSKVMRYGTRPSSASARDDLHTIRKDCMSTGYARAA